MTPDFDLTDPLLYDHWVDENVRFSDTDQAGHVNNTAITKYVRWFGEEKMRLLVFVGIRCFPLLFLWAGRGFRILLPTNLGCH